MNSPALPLLTLILGVTLGALLGWVAATARHTKAQATGADPTATARADAAQWQARAEELAARAALAEERADRDASVLRALAPVRAHLEYVGAKVDTMQREGAAQHAALTEQLRASAAQDRELARTTAHLASALRSRSSRGLWGEAELARVLEASGMLAHVDFSEQRTIGSILAQRAHDARHTTAPRPDSTGTTARPDVVIHLPGDGYLALDAKAPMDAYLRAIDADESNDNTRNTHLAAHAKALRTHVDALAARRYDRALGHSPELVVLFIPAEAILAAALDADPTLMDYAMQRAVALTSPSSLLGLLKVCATAWARQDINDDAEELLELGRTLYERLGTVAGHLDTLGTTLSRSVTAYNRTVASLESRLLVTARSLNSLGASPTAPRHISPGAAQVRRLSSPELLGDNPT